MSYYEPSSLSKEYHTLVLRPEASFPRFMQVRMHVGSILRISFQDVGSRWSAILLALLNLRLHSSNFFFNPITICSASWPRGTSASLAFHSLLFFATYLKKDVHFVQKIATPFLRSDKIFCFASPAVSVSKWCRCHTLKIDLPLLERTKIDAK